jgi:hypothetical protein
MNVKKTRKKRTPMSPEQRAAATERLAKARAAKGPSQNVSIHESIRDLDDDHPLSPKRVKEWIKSCRDELKANRSHRLSNDVKEKAPYYALEGYVRNMQIYLSTGVWNDMFYGAKRSIRMYPVCVAPAMNSDGSRNYTYGVYYTGLGVYEGNGIFKQLETE